MATGTNNTDESKKGDRVVRTTMVTLYVTLIILLLVSLIKCNREGSYDTVDMVLCIDATGSMSSILNTVTTHAVGFCNDLKQKCEERGKHVENLHVRVIGFRDIYDHGDDSFVDSKKFFNLPDEDAMFKDFMFAIQPLGGRDTEESGLEALALAMNSEWCSEGNRQCRVIMLWTDAPPKSLRGALVDTLTTPSSLEGLQQWWETEKMGTSPKRLVLFSPYVNEWRAIHENWSDVTHSTDYTNPEDYDNIIDKIVEAL